MVKMLMGSTTTRKHAAIMFTDIVGYTALMGSDEDKAFEVLAINRKIHSNFIAQYHGTLIKEMGDGMLISFDLASDAVRCATEIQKACKAEDIPLKIGIHEGEMVFEGHDVLGDGVNIASRIQDKAEAGFILISEAIHRDIKNKHDIEVDFIGEGNFKNIPEALKVFAVKYPGSPDPRKISIISSPNHSIINQPLVRISSALIIIAAGVVFFLFYRGTSIPFTERDWIVISDFENVTDEEIFDHSLNTAFVLSIDQSRYINVITRQMMKETLKRMKKEGTSEINEEIAREIAIRERVKICVIPAISRVGTKYILSSKIQDAETGSILKAEVLYVDALDGILKKLDQLSKKTRRNLGESRFEIYGQSKPLSKVTTSSLDALKEFSLGVENHTNLDFEQAKIHYENAIQLDSNFTSAKASLGNLLYERFDREEGRKWLEEAITSIDQITEKEKYGILAFYAVNIENDIEKGIEYAKSRIDLYPDDPVARNNLGWYYQNTGKFTKAVEEYKAAIQINPYLMIPYGGLIWIQLEKLARLDSAKVWSEKMIRINPENPWGYCYLGSVYVGLDNLEKAIENYQKSIELNPGLFLSQYRLAHVYRILGEFEKSNEVLQNILKINPGEIPVHYDMGINYHYEGKKQLAKECALKFLEKAENWEETFPDSPGTYTSIGAGWTLLGEKEKGWEIGKKAIEMDSSFHFNYAVFLSAQGKKEEAMDHLEKALKNGYRDIVWIKLNSGLDAVRNETRFQELIKEYFG
jgi:class 3 adenylate cyclase/tetratricopeptide (TPR) repeat protein